MQQKRTHKINGKDTEFRVHSYAPHYFRLLVEVTPNPQKLFSTPCEVTRNLGDTFDPGTRLPMFCSHVDITSKRSRLLLEGMVEKKICRQYEMNGKPVITKIGIYEYPVYEFNKKALDVLDPYGTSHYEYMYKSEEYLQDKQEIRPEDDRLLTDLTNEELTEFLNNLIKSTHREPVGITNDESDLHKR